jgi:hypothetical protein
MKLSNRNLQRNWMLRNEAAIKEAIAGAYGSKDGKEQDKSLPLYEQIKAVFELPEPKIPAQNGTDYELTFLQLSETIRLTPPDNEHAKKLKELLKPKKLIPQQAELLQNAEAVPQAENKDKDKDEDAQGSTLALLPKTVDKKNVYEKGFEYFAKNRKLAQQNGLLWLAQHQLKQLKALHASAKKGKKWSKTYGLAVGLSLAGYLALTIGFGTISGAYGWVLLPLAAGGFSAYQNFWVTRTEPTELLFDQYPGEETEELSNKKRWGAAIAGTLNTLLLTGCLVFGIWEILGAFGLTNVAVVGLPVVLGVSMGISLVLSSLYFLPELSLGIKFNREWVKINPWIRFKNLLKDVAEEKQTFDLTWDWFSTQLGHLFSLNETVDKPFKAGATFLGLISCVLVGAVFTALAVAELAALIMPFEIAVVALIGVALTGIAFYYSKADTEVRRQFGIEGQKTLEPEEKILRVLNALVNGIPAFLGGAVVMGVNASLLGTGGLSVAALAGAVGFGLFTGFCGFVASYLSGADGWKQGGHEPAIQKEIDATDAVINDLQNRQANLTPEPELYNSEGKLQKVTEFPMLFKAPFYRSEETEGTEEAILTASSEPTLKMKVS